MRTGSRREESLSFCSRLLEAVCTERLGEEAEVIKTGTRIKNSQMGGKFVDEPLSKLAVDLGLVQLGKPEFGFKGSE